MNPTQRFTIYMKYLFADLPPVSWGRLIMPLAFIGCWTLLRGSSVGESVAFVWSAVVAQFVQIWTVLPVTVSRQRRLFGRARPAVLWAMTLLFATLVFQVWLQDPVVTHRVVSFYCLAYAGIMWWGVSGDPMVRERFVPVGDRTDLPEVFRTHLLKLYGLISILLLIVNEALVAAQSVFHIRVIVLSLAPIVLHYVFYVLLRATCPRLDEEDA